MINLDRNVMISDASKAAEKLGWKLVFVKSLPHPNDSHLMYTIVERKSIFTPNTNDFATHLYNGEFKSFNHGHYDIDSYEAAKKDLKERLE
jgi:hypothetical protein